MKVLFDAHPSVEERTGIGRYCDNLIRALPQPPKDLQIYIYSNLDKNKPPNYYAKHTVYSFPVRHGLARSLVGLNLAVAKTKANILHTTTLSPFPKLVPTVFTVHDLCFKTHPHAYRTKTKLAFSLFFKQSVERADAIIVPSKTAKKALMTIYPTSSKKASVIHEASDPLFKPIKNKHKVLSLLKRKFGIDKKFYLVVGNLEKRKKPLETIDAFRRLKNKNVYLVFVGPNLLNRMSLKKFERKAADSQIKILKFVSDYDLNQLYNGAVALVYNSLCEGFGLPIVEAMSCKLPVIASDIAVFREVASNAALFFKDKRSLYKAMENVLTNRKLRQKYAHLGYKRSKVFSWEKAARKTLEVYKRVLNR